MKKFNYKKDSYHIDYGQRSSQSMEEFLVRVAASKARKDLKVLLEGLKQYMYLATYCKQLVEVEEKKL